MGKADAQRKLDQIISDSTRQQTGLPNDPTFSELWGRFRALKSANWGSANNRAVSSVFKNQVIPVLGSIRVRALTRDPLQGHLNQMALSGASYSALHKVRTYLAAALEYAMDERIISENPAAKMTVPTKLITKKINEQFYSIDQCKNLLTTMEGREHLIIRLFLVCGFRPAELFVLRADDVEERRLRVDEALKETERGDKRIGETKTTKSTGYVSISVSLRQEIEVWMAQSVVQPGSKAFLFPSSSGTPFTIRNYIQRILEPLAARAGVPDITYQALRRTFATHFQRHGTPRSAQAAMRHSSLRMTGWYMKEIPEEVQRAVADWDAELIEDLGRVM
jgi:integrase